jgi:hypothetical protein
LAQPFPLLFTPTVDVNSDGIVDPAEIGIVVDDWAKDFSLCDINPIPHTNVQPAQSDPERQ